MAASVLVILGVVQVPALVLAWMLYLSLVVAGQTFEAGNTDPYYHGVSRSPVLEGEATNRVIRLAEAAGEERP